MNIAGAMRNVYDASPESVRVLAGLGMRVVPPGVLFGKAFRQAWEHLATAEEWGLRDTQADQVNRLRRLIEFAGKEVPYYRETFNELGLQPGDIRCVDDIAGIPLLTRAMVAELRDELSPENLNPRSYRHQTTGGTSGTPLGFHIDHDASAREWAYMQWLWGRRGFRLGDRRIVLRGRAISGRNRGRIWESDPVNRALYFSSFDLTDELLPRIVEKMRSCGAVFLHAYPSSATIIAEHLQDSGGRLPNIRGLLLGSENMLPGQREFLEKAFGVRVFTWYGHSEKCILAGECEHDTAYHAFPSYGVTELVNENGEPVRDAGTPGILVGTGFLNRATVMIRYITDDRAQWVDTPCTCGRPGRRLSNVTGRWNQEMLIGASGGPISMTALNLHSDVYTRMRRFRFVQDERGLAYLEYVPTEGFTEHDESTILAELAAKVEGEITVLMRQVTSLPLTESGKFRFIEQHLDTGGSPWEHPRGRIEGAQDEAGHAEP